MVWYEARIGDENVGGVREPQTPEDCQEKRWERRGQVKITTYPRDSIAEFDPAVILSPLPTSTTLLLLESTYRITNVDARFIDILNHNSTHPYRDIVTDPHALSNGGICTEVDTSTKYALPADICAWGGGEEVPELTVVPDGCVEVEMSMPADFDVACQDRTSCHDTAFPYLDPLGDHGSWMNN